MSKKVLVINDGAHLGSSYYTPFKEFGEYTNDLEMIGNPELVLVVFTGGEDVDPSLYNEQKHHTTYSNLKRDEYEVAAFKKARKFNLPLAGICRGAQFLCVMAGGKLVQDVRNHSGYHGMRTEDGRLLEVNSTHHQMQIPPKDAKILAWAEPARSKTYFWNKPDKEFECVAYPNINALSMQYHPEVMSKKSDGFKYCLELTKKLLNKELF